MSGLSYTNGGVEFKTELHTKTGPGRTLLVSGEHLAHVGCHPAYSHTPVHVYVELPRIRAQIGVSPCPRSSLLRFALMAR